jgi:hypothetical protein
MEINLKILTEAISEHIPPNQVSYLNEKTIILKGCKITFNGSLVQYNNTSCRINTVKSFLYELWASGLLACSGETLFHIQNRYRHINQSLK